MQLTNYLKVKQSTAWFMLQRLKYVTDCNLFKESFNNTVIETDECYIGGKKTNKHKSKKFKEEKSVVLGIMDRKNKQVKTFHTKDAKYSILDQKIVDNVEMNSILITDESTAYKTLDKLYEHHPINHLQSEYIKKDLARQSVKVHTNTVEGYWAFVKRTINDTHHWISKKYLQRYLSEMSFRYNLSNLINSDRFSAFIANVQGRLRYRELVDCV